MVLLYAPPTHLEDCRDTWHESSEGDDIGFFFVLIPIAAVLVAEVGIGAAALAAALASVGALVGISVATMTVAFTALGSAAVYWALDWVSQEIEDALRYIGGDDLVAISNAVNTGAQDSIYQDEHGDWHVDSSKVASAIVKSKINPLPAASEAALAAYFHAPDVEKQFANFDPRLWAAQHAGVWSDSATAYPQEFMSAMGDRANAHFLQTRWEAVIMPALVQAGVMPMPTDADEAARVQAAFADLAVQAISSKLIEKQRQIDTYNAMIATYGEHTLTPDEAKSRLAAYAKYEELQRLKAAQDAERDAVYSAHELTHEQAKQRLSDYAALQEAKRQAYQRMLVTVGGPLASLPGPLGDAARQRAQQILTDSKAVA